jgi:hypothetical protein
MAEVKYLVDEVDKDETTVLTVAVCTSWDAAVGAFEAVTKRRPPDRYLLRQGARVIRRSYPA